MRRCQQQQQQRMHSKFRSKNISKSTLGRFDQHPLHLLGRCFFAQAQSSAKENVEGAGKVKSVAQAPDFARVERLVSCMKWGVALPCQPRHGQNARGKQLREPKGADGRKLAPWARMLASILRGFPRTVLRMGRFHRRFDEGCGSGVAWAALLLPTAAGMASHLGGVQRALPQLVPSLKCDACWRPGKRPPHARCRPEGWSWISNQLQASLLADGCPAA